MFRRRYALFALPMAIALCGCDSDPGPTVPSTVEKTKEATAATPPAAKTTEGGRPVSASEPAPGGPPTKGTP